MESAEPTYEQYMLPVLKVMADGNVRKNADIRLAVLAVMKLDPSTLTSKQKSGNFKYKDNINFAISYLSMAGCLNRQDFGVYRISDLGLTIVSNKDIKELSTEKLMDISPEFKERIASSHRRGDSKTRNNKPFSEERNPMDQAIESGRIYKETKKDEILSMLRSLSEDKQINRDRDDAFEHICLDLLIAMGYGFDDEESGFVTKKSGDGGVDGVIVADKLGFERIAYQAKRWNNPVGRKEVSQFVGDFDFAKCTKGVFITTSYFQPQAIEFAQSHKNLILIDGNKLVDLMYDYGVGVSKKFDISIKDIDTDYFSELDFID